MRILVLNPGSVTLKATVLDPPDADPRFNRTVTWLHEDEPDGRARTVEAVAREMAEAGIDLDTIDGVGYRVVHGGTEFAGLAAGNRVVAGLTFKSA